MIIDIGLVLFAGAGFWLGYTKGIVRTLFVVVLYAIALLLTLALSPFVMHLMIRWLSAGPLFALIFGTIFTMILLIFLLHWMLRSVEKYLKKSKLGAFSKAFGGIMMMLVAMLIYSYLIWGVASLNWINTGIRERSYSLTTLEKVPVKTKSFVIEFKPLFKRYWELMEKTFDKGNEPAPQE